jgi:hypothetical protein
MGTSPTRKPKNLGDGCVGLILDVDTLVQMPYQPPQPTVRVSLPRHEPKDITPGLHLPPGREARASRLEPKFLI